MARKKIEDLSPKFRIPTAEQELELVFSGERPIGNSMGGLQMFSNSFKRGYGDRVFGSDDNGIWLGAADFINAPFRVDMSGRIYSGSGDSENGVVIDGPNIRVLLVKEGIVRGIWGDDGT